MTVSKDNGLIERVEDALSQIRPFLKEDGGDVGLVEITQDYVVKIEFKGACLDCSMSNMTFKAGVEEIILSSVPEISKVEAINL